MMRTNGTMVKATMLALAATALGCGSGGGGDAMDVTDESDVTDVTDVADEPGIDAAALIDAAPPTPDAAPLTCGAVGTSTTAGMTANGITITSPGAAVAFPMGQTFGIGITGPAGNCDDPDGSYIVFNPCETMAVGTYDVVATCDDGVGVTIVASSDLASADATGGTVTFTSVDPACITGSFDAAFDAQGITGEFAATSCAVVAAAVGTPTARWHR